LTRVLLENCKQVSLLFQAKLLSQLTTISKNINTEWRMTSITDADLEVRNKSGDTQ